MKTILVDAINSLIIKDQGVFKEMQALLDSYENRKIILTNANDEEFEKFSLNNVPYEIFTLKHSPDKPDPKYYQLMLEHFNLKSKDVIYFEHNQEAAESAQSVGINTYHYDKDIKDLKSLKEFIDQNI